MHIDQTEIEMVLQNLKMNHDIHEEKITTDEEFGEFRDAIMAGFYANCTNPKHNHGEIEE